MIEVFRTGIYTFLGCKQDELGLLFIFDGVQALHLREDEIINCDVMEGEEYKLSLDNGKIRIEEVPTPMGF